LIEEQRRDDPNLTNADTEVKAMTAVADPSALSQALDGSHHTMLRQS
jgi:hypothetical protein